MQNNIIRKGLVSGIILLLFGMSIIPGIAGEITLYSNRKNVVPVDTENLSVKAGYKTSSHNILISKLQFFLPSYNCSGGEESGWNTGLRSYYNSYWIARHKTGYLHTDVETRATGALSEAQANASAWIIGPKEGKFKPETSGKHYLLMIFLLNGEAKTTSAGGGEASSFMNIKGCLYNYDTNELIGSSTRVLYWGIRDIKFWTFRLFLIAFPVNISSSNYYFFKSQLYAEHSAEGRLIGGSAETSSSLTARLCTVLLFAS